MSYRMLIKRVQNFFQLENSQTVGL